MVGEAVRSAKIEAHKDHQWRRLVQVLVVKLMYVSGGKSDTSQLHCCSHAFVLCQRGVTTCMKIIVPAPKVSALFQLLKLMVSTGTIRGNTVLNLVNNTHRYSHMK